MQLSEARRRAKAAGVTFLLTPPENNPKTAKSKKAGWDTPILNLMPADASGYEVCPMRTRGCTESCLHYAGSPAWLRNKTESRMRKTRFYFEERAAFMTLLAHEIEVMDPVGVRLNGTSDIPWERVKHPEGETLMDMFPGIQFYDYTKRWNRQPPANYHLTFSLAEDNDERALEAWKNGMNVAAVFAVPPKKALPKTFNLCGQEIPVVDGDLHDYRPADPKGVIVGLRAKGLARRDTTGFVRRAA